MTTIMKSLLNYCRSFVTGSISRMQVGPYSGKKGDAKLGDKEARKVVFQSLGVLMPNRY
jgi:hypothetical protein